MRRLLGYLLQYRPRDMVDMVQNGKRPVLDCDVPFAGKTAVITGATSGIGYETARLLAARGARLVCMNRSEDRSRALEAELSRDYGARVATILCDFTSLDQTRRAGEALGNHPESLDLVVLNAGIYNEALRFTPDGIEEVFQVNHLSSFLLLSMLEERLRREDRARVVLVNSEGHRFALGGVHCDDLAWERHRYSGLKAYGAAKTAQLLCMPSFVAAFAGSGVCINALHPGNVRTAIGDQNGPDYLRFKERVVLRKARPAVDAARAIYWLGADPAMAGVRGKYYSFTTEERVAPHARDPIAAREVWETSRRLCGLA